MTVKSLTLKNFRCFKEIHIDFDERLTVLVGINGAGKTTILDGLVFFLRPIMQRISNPHVGWNYIEIEASNLFIEAEIDKISCELKIFDRNLDWDFVQHKTDSNRMLLDKDPAGMKDLRPIEDYIVGEGEKNGFPIYVSYSAQRYMPKTSSKIANSPFEDGFTPEINLQTSLKWFDGKDAEEARIRSNKKDLHYKDPHLFAVREAITQSLDGDIYEFPHMDGVPPELYINNKQNGRAYRVTPLSDGYKTMLATVMDLARRMAMTNSENFSRTDRPDQPPKSVLESQGVVLIDEVDLHLHPSWQQTVLQTLMKIFPNIQFIVTTHSPQVLTSIPARHIRILADGKAHTFDQETDGTESARLLQQVFGVDPRPQQRPEFFTTLRCCLGQPAEDHLRSVNYQG